MRMLFNLGCGSRFHPAWRNMDLHAIPPHVEAWTVETGIPCETGKAAMCYASHLLEHLDPESAAKFLQECRRVLAPGGLIRIVVPDLEVICRRYVAQLDELVAGGGNDETYDWSVLELLDQLVRTQSGGRVLPFLRNPTDTTRTVVLERWGTEAVGLFEVANFAGTTSSSNPLRRWVRKSRAKIAQWITGLDRKTLEVARFRTRGEVHQWMYDRCSLKRLLENSGFADVRICGAQESALPGWSEYGLDADSQGRIHKPDSLFIEGEVNKKQNGAT